MKINKHIAWRIIFLCIPSSHTVVQTMLNKLNGMKITSVDTDVCLYAVDNT